MDDSAEGHSAPAQPDGAVPAPIRSRRGFLLVGTLTVAATAAGGVALGLSTGSKHPDALVAHVPEELAAAVGAERDLIAMVDSAIPRARGRRRAYLRLIRADHTAHLAALEAVIADTVYPAAPPSASQPAGSVASASAPPANGSPAAVRTAEKHAGQAAAARALRFTGRNATLLASIAASEASHAELLS